ncbi:hypothetical protein K4F52_003840 [Lecanicillium sp. MT-2017a]|nr:hypothetical protein K4F52_003840 [Lecanicillium sp. MT-2017a]
MRLDFAVAALSLLTSVSAAAINEQHQPRVDVAVGSDEHDLYKRKGGGRGGGRGGSSSGNRGGSSGSSSGNRGGSGSSPPPNTRPNSNVGGVSPQGSGPQPRFGGGQFYGGGAKQPFRPGGRARGGAGLAAGGLLVGSALAFWPGLWLAGAYMYPYHHPYRFHNETTDEEEELPVICGCARYNPCSCDEDGNSTVYLDEIVGNGSYAGLNKSIVNVGKVDDESIEALNKSVVDVGQKVLLINGTLPNGTTAEDPDAEGADSDAAGNSMKSHLEALGYWPVLATVAAIVLSA